jgi:hypothetical protein
MRSTAWCDASRYHLNRLARRCFAAGRYPHTGSCIVAGHHLGARDPTIAAASRYGTMVGCSKPEATQPTPIC